MYLDQIKIGVLSGNFPFVRGIKKSEQLMTHSMDEKVSITSRTQNVTVTNAALCDSMRPGKAPGNA